MGNGAGFEDAWREERKIEAGRWWKAERGNIASLNALRNNAWPRRKEDARRFTWLRCTRMHLQPPIHSRADGGCSDPLPSPGMNGTHHPRTGSSSSFIRTRRRPLTCRVVCFNGEASLSLLTVEKKLERTWSQKYIYMYLSLSLVNM